MIPAPKTAGLDDLLAIPERERHHEILNGELVEKIITSAKHGMAQLQFGSVFRPYNRKPGGRLPGGWWFASEVEIMFASDQICRPDVAGWRRERLAEPPAEVPVRVRPDWICEIVFPPNATSDTVRKKRIYHRFQVPHYWVIDPRDETLAVYRWSEDGFIEVLVALRGERVQAEPFDAISLQVGVFFGDDEEDE